MEKEYSTSHQMGNLPNFFIVLILSFFPLLGVFLFLVAIYVPYNSYVFEGETIAFSIRLFIFTMLLAISAFIIGWTLIKICLARYRFEDIGLAIKYPLEKEIIVPWEDFQQICVCYAAYTTRGERRASTVICCVKKGETKTSIGRWKTDNIFRYRSVICIVYSEPLLNGITEKYPGTVVDLRDTPQYRL